MVRGEQGRGLGGGGKQRGDVRAAVQGVTQLCQFARAGAAEGDAGGDALDVSAVAQGFAQGVAFIACQQGGDGIVAGGNGCVVA